MTNKDNTAKLQKLFKQAKYAILSILFPIECLGCAREDVWLCERCLNKIKYNIDYQCVVCKKGSDFGLTHSACRKETKLDGVVIASFGKDNFLRGIIGKYKYNLIKELCDPLAQILINKIILSKQHGHNFLLKNDFTVMPVPLHKRRLRWRGFNQSQLLAEKIAVFFGLNTASNVLVRKKYTKPQVKFKRKKRIKNILNSFKINSGIQFDFKNTNVLLVDDVLTTGSTLNECARVLKEGGVKKVWAIVLTRG
ncbi:MAG: ComF family protein [Candidatus Kuenenbacteria bacterium]